MGRRFVILVLFLCLTLHLAFLDQATVAERATAFKQHCELAETVKLKEINLYDSVMLLFSYDCCPLKIFSKSIIRSILTI